VRNGIGAAALAALLSLCGAARADLTFSGTGTGLNGDPLSATVTFGLTGTDFSVVLSNLGQPTAQGSVLTNLAFNSAPLPAQGLPNTTGTISLPGTSVFVGKAATTSLGANWAYLVGGIASSGYGVGTGSGNLCGTVCTGAKLSDASFGLIGKGTNLSPQGLQAAKNTYIENAVRVDITLAATSTFKLSDITTVDFQYGTSAGEGDIYVTICSGGSDCTAQLLSPTPEPLSIVLFGSGLLGLALVRRGRT
jgi:hypothetical protein